LAKGIFSGAYQLFEVGEQYGAVPLKTKVSTGIELEFTRGRPQRCLCTNLISDFDSAYNLLANGTASSAT